jgi:uncharacterized short protein YbdD (DUF466 family)
MLEASGGLAGVFGRFRALGERGREAWHGVFGIPDYDAYLAHRRATHPGETPLGRGEFLAWALERRHAGSGPRCC